MRASLQNDWLFLANPRCGSTSLRAALSPCSDLVSRSKAEGTIRHHWTAAEAGAYLAKIGRDISEFEVFTTTRHPWARAASAYVFGGRNPRSVWAETRASAPSFSEFIRHPKFRERLFDLDAFTSIEQRAEVTVFAMEHLAAGRPRMEQIVGKPIELPELNQSDAYDYRSFYKDGDAEFVAKLFQSDIDAFGYVFDNVEAEQPWAVLPSQGAEPQGVIDLAEAPIHTAGGVGHKDDPDWRSRMNAAGQTPKWSPQKFKAPKREMGGIDEAHHRVYGRPWIFGRVQFEQLVRRGLKPRHDVLDLGCGVGRTGIWLIPFLKPGRYVGIESHAKSLEAFARYEVPLHGLADRQPLLIEDDQFRLGETGRTFDFILDFCVTIHLTPEWRAKAVEAMRSVLKPGGRIVLAQEPSLSADELASFGLAVAHSETVDIPLLADHSKESARRMDWHELEAIR